MTPTQDVAARKSALRRRLAAARAARPGDERAAATEAVRGLVAALPEVAAARVVAAYAATPAEVGTAALLDDLDGRGVRVLLPVVRADLDLDWAPYAGPGSLAPGALGVPGPTTAPLGVEALTEADVVLVPGVAVDPAGRRLGRGGGSYDRALARVAPGALVVVLLHEDEVVEEVPVDPHDRPVDAVVTPAGVRRFGG